MWIFFLREARFHQQGRGHVRERAVEQNVQGARIIFHRFIDNELRSG